MFKNMTRLIKQSNTDDNETSNKSPIFFEDGVHLGQAHENTSDPPLIGTAVISPSQIFFYTESQIKHSMYVEVLTNRSESS